MMKSVVSCVLCTCALVLAAVPAAAECRDYILVDSDSGERVEGCVQTQVDSSLLKAPVLTPALLNHVRFGWKIDALSRGDVLARMGLRPGDVLLSVNGQELAPQETPALIAEALGAYGKLEILVGHKPQKKPAIKPAASVATVMEVSQSSKGFKLDKIPEGSFFDTIGLQAGDVVVSIAGSKVRSLESLNALAKEAESLNEVHVIVLRAGQELDLLIKTQ